MSSFKDHFLVRTNGCSGTGDEETNTRSHDGLKEQESIGANHGEEFGVGVAAGIGAFFLRIEDKGSRHAWN